MKKSIIYYFAVDSYSGLKTVLDDFDKKSLEIMHDNGIEFEAVYDDKSTEIIPWDKVEKPIPPEDEIITIPIISHETFKAMIEPMIEAIGEIESQQAMPVSSISINSTKSSNKPKSSLYENLKSIYDGIVEGFEETE